MAAGTYTAATLPADAVITPVRRSQIIVKFSIAVADPANPAYLESLGQALGGKVTYLRAMSGGVHVLIVEHAPGMPLVRLLQRFNGRSDVVYAEDDARKFPTHRGEGDPVPGSRVY